MAALTPPMPWTAAPGGVLAEQMNTDAGRAEALRRTEFMRAFLDQLGHELP